MQHVHRPAPMASGFFFGVLGGSAGILVSSPLLVKAGIITGLAWKKFAFIISSYVGAAAVGFYMCQGLLGRNLVIQPAAERTVTITERVIRLMPVILAAISAPTLSWWFSLEFSVGVFESIVYVLSGFGCLYAVVALGRAGCDVEGCPLRTLPHSERAP